MYCDEPENRFELKVQIFIGPAYRIDRRGVHLMKIER